jgi:hypothetical protein
VSPLPLFGFMLVLSYGCVPSVCIIVHNDAAQNCAARRCGPVVGHAVPAVLEVTAGSQPGFLFLVLTAIITMSDVPACMEP